MRPNAKFALRAACKRIMLRFVCWLLTNTAKHKRTAWECRGCGRMPNAGKLAIIWANYTATFTFN